MPLESVVIYCSSRFTLCIAYWHCRVQLIWGLLMFPSAVKFANPKIKFYGLSGTYSIVCFMWDMCILVLCVGHVWVCQFAVQAQSDLKCKPLSYVLVWGLLEWWLTEQMSSLASYRSLSKQLAVTVLLKVTMMVGFIFTLASLLILWPSLVTCDVT